MHGLRSNLVPALAAFAIVACAHHEPSGAAPDAASPAIRVASGSAGEPPMSGPMRGAIIESRPGANKRFRYDYYDVQEPDSSMQYLLSLHYQGGGPSWEGIVYGLLTLRAPATLTVVTFDAEAEGLAIWSDDRKALETIGHLVGVAKGSRDLMLAAIDVAKRDGRME